MKFYVLLREIDEKTGEDYERAYLIDGDNPREARANGLKMYPEKLSVEKEKAISMKMAPESCVVVIPDFHTLLSHYLLPFEQREPRKMKYYTTSRSDEEGNVTKYRVLAKTHKIAQAATDHMTKEELENHTWFSSGYEVWLNRNPFEGIIVKEGAIWE